MRLKLKIVLPPLIFSLYPSIALLGENYSVIGVEEVLRSAIVSVGFAVILLILFYMFFKDWRKSSLSSLLVQLLFFSYGHVYDLLNEKKNPLTREKKKNRYLGPLWVIIFVLGFIWIWRNKKNVLSFISSLNIIFLVALVFPIYNVVVYEYTHKVDPQDLISSVNELPIETVPDFNLPDVYYIVLDEYGRDDALLEIFNFDNSEFLEKLGNNNFEVALCSQSNYARTSLSISSALNMNYIDQFFDVDQIISKDTDIEDLLSDSIKHSLARMKLEEFGYQTIAFETGFSFSEIIDADYYYYPAQDEEITHPFFDKINRFESLLLNSTIIRFFITSVPPVAEILVPLLEFPNQIDRARTLWILDKLETIPDIEGPKFVFAHIVSPHEPFVFSADGSYPVPEPDYFPGYPDQIQYLNQRILQLIDSLQENSKTPPIIIIQGDHSFRIVTDLKWRMAVLNAYYLPGITGDDNIVYPSITPINSFRLILNKYFDFDYEYLEDRAYFSDFENPEIFTYVPLERICD